MQANSQRQAPLMTGPYRLEMVRVGCCDGGLWAEQNRAHVRVREHVLQRRQLLLSLERAFVPELLNAVDLSCS